MKLLQGQALDNMKLLQSLALAEGVLRIKRHWTVYEITKYDKTYGVNVTMFLVFIISCEVTLETALSVCSFVINAFSKPSKSKKQYLFLYY